MSFGVGSSFFLLLCREINFVFSLSFVELTTMINFATGNSIDRRGVGRSHQSRWPAEKRIRCLTHVISNLKVKTSRQRAARSHTDKKKGRAERKEREKMKYQRLQMTTQSSLPFQTLTECKTSDIICVSLSTVTQSRDRKTMASSVQNKNKNEIISFYG
jgi:hypothetical protein